MDNRKRCPKCGSVNDGFFEYCFKCGTPLSSAPFGGAAPNRYGYYEPETIAGHPTEEVKAFVGQSVYSQVLTRKMIDTQISGARTHWCWPVFLFSLFGPMFAAIWFFYRKMYKTGMLVALAGMLLTGADVLLHLEYNVALMREVWDILKTSSDANQVLARLQEDVSTLPSQSSIEALLTAVIDLLSLGFGVVMAMFAVGIYKGHVGKTLSGNPAIKSNYFTLAAAGGTSVAAAILSGVALWILFNLISNLSVFIVLATL